MVPSKHILQTTKIVSAYLGRNAATSQSLPTIIESVAMALIAAPYDAMSEPTALSKEFYFCKECGGKYYRLHRHVIAHHGMNIREYIAKWGKPKPPSRSIWRGALSHLAGE